MVMLFQEVEYVWPRLGYPPLVTPFSQYVKNTALMNLMNILKGQPRWTTIDKDTWNMILGRMGQLPGPLDPEIIALAQQKGLEFYSGNPQDEFPNELDRYRQIMVEEGWNCGQDDEELFELAMHERQYRDYRSGLAKERFNAELEAAKAKAGAPIIIERPVVEIPKVDIAKILEQYPDAVAVQSPVKGQVMWNIDVDDVSMAPVTGTSVSAEAPMAHIQTYYGLEEVVPVCSGRVVAVCAGQGDRVAKGEILAFIRK
jgi:pyruvate carboxylase subunit B